MTLGLVTHLTGSRRAYDLRCADSAVTLARELGYLTRVHGGVRLDNVLLRVSTGVTDILERDPDTLWVVDVHGGVGSAVPFQPPRTLNWEHALPLVVTEEQEAKLKELLPRFDGELLNDAAVRVGEERLIFLGQDAFGGTSGGQQRTLTIWLPGGEALVTKLVEDAGRGWLLLVDVVKRREAANVQPGVNLLVRVLSGASIPVVRATEAGAEAPAAPSGAAAASVVQTLKPPTSAMLEAWRSYTVLALALSKEKTKAREPHALHFERGKQDGSAWRFDVRLSDEAAEAWLGEDYDVERWIRVDQPVGFPAKPDEELNTIGTVVEMRVRAGDHVEAKLDLARGETDLPETGTLEARENRGVVVKTEREVAAAELLGSGLAACPRLATLLADPELTRPPELRSRLPVPADGPLDASQEHAVQMILGCSELVAIQGPPGTGKTRVIVEAIRQIAAMAAANKQPARILISSVQNEAVSNVTERFQGLTDVVLRTEHRKARDDDEAREMAKRANVQAEGVIAKLKERVGNWSEHALRGRIREVTRTVEHARTLYARGAAERAALALQALADEELLRAELKRELPALLPREVPEVGVAPMPSAPEAIEAWWSQAAPSIAADERASLGVRVDAVVAACAHLNPLRRKLAIERAWPDLLAAWQASAASQRQVEAAPPEDLGRVEAWMVSALAELEQLAAKLDGDPAAIVARFLQRLETEPRAWAAIVAKHGTGVAATCSMAAKALRADEEPFDWVIIDEVGRASPYELMIPMVLGKRIVLIGDDRQLPPTVDDAIVAMLERDPLAVAPEATTLFGELRRLLPAACTTRLETQYRMHAMIGDAVSDLFYSPHGETLYSHFAGPLAEKRVATWGVFGDAPLVWHEVPQARGDCTEENPAEARAVVELLHRYSQADDADGQVAVICLYRRQRALVQRMIDKDKALSGRFRVHTADGVQGREFPVVILCTTRTVQSPGFLRSTNRINVAISRAQRQLVIVGKSDVILNSWGRGARHLVDLVRIARASHRGEP